MQKSAGGGEGGALQMGFSDPHDSRGQRQTCASQRDKRGSVIHTEENQTSQVNRTQMSDLWAESAGV